MRSDRFHAHVLALPVDTEIAQVRGVHGVGRRQNRLQMILLAADLDALPDAVVKRRQPDPVLLPQQ